MAATINTYYNMSKGNMLLGFARGKVGSLVFSRANGKQITRAKADVIKNPQTRAQFIQRIILNTVAQAYSNMQPIVDHSFEGIQKGQKSMSFFMKKNMDMLREKIAAAQKAGLSTSEIYNFAAIGTDDFLVNDYLIAKGQLPKIDLSMPPAGDEDDYSLIEGLAANTYQGVCDAFGLQRGDQLTFVQIDALGFHFARIILDPRNEDNSEAPMSSIFILDNYVGLPNWKNEGAFYSLVYEEGKVKFAVKNAGVLAGAVIVSRKDEDDTWLRSTTYLKAQVTEESGYQFDSLEDAINESMIGITLGSDRYLNNAGVGGASGTRVVTPKVTSVTFDGNAYPTPKTWQVAEGSSSVVLGGITTKNLDENKTYVVKVKSEGGNQLGSDIAVNAEGSVASTTINGSEGNTYNVGLYEDGVLISTFATISIPEDHQAPPEGGGFGG